MIFKLNCQEFFSCNPEQPQAQKCGWWQHKQLRKLALEVTCLSANLAMGTSFLHMVRLYTIYHLKVERCLLTQVFRVI